MATCGFGTSGIHDFKLDLGLVKAKSSNLQPVYGLRVKKFVQLDGLVLSHRSKKAISENRSSNSKVDLVSTGLEDNSKDMVSSARPSTLIPNSSEVESVLTQLCDTASISEFELKLGGFQLHVRRELAEQSTTQEPLFPAPVTAHSVVETSGSSSNNSAAASSLVVAKSVTSSGGVQTLLEKSADEGLTIVQSPRVGYFRRCRTIKGKQAPPSCKEKDTVKEGQVLCYIDQLGAQIPVETDISGEVVKILKGDGDPVGYGDALIAVLPSFPGIMKLQ